ncbi:MBL fold metallo-hydrolase [Haloechinothrix sp. LS1_15]|uniref:MBL fold metallo-hydrolase n=1 Tax=Haloechinothrix sp. LS1_15 TaxID=2652248 RepID=UPI0029444981|nr:MBL fold metallo-hydrolase [Haloechinothrix sp. LS1_15]MDV6011820.1 MBL fold metallo-hydrolase [Haloechinothrix sp. LS1_15]
MRLTILGCAGSIPGPNTNASGYLVEADGYTLGLELGNGTLSALQAMRGPFALDALLLSHLHPDHCADVAALTVLHRYHPQRPTDGKPGRLPVYGPDDTAVRLANLYAPNERERAETDLADVFEFHAMPREPTRIGPFEVTAFPVLHPTPAFGVRIAYRDLTFAYTGDTDVCPELDQLAASADVLLAEATWTESDDRPVGVHLSGAAAGELAARAGVRRLMLTHIAPWTDRAKIYAEARTAYTGDVELVEQGAVYEF